MAKYTIKELMDSNEPMSHIFLGSIPVKDIKKIATKNKNWQEGKDSLKVYMSIDGISVNPRVFFKEMMSQYSKIVEKAAKKLLHEKYSGALDNLEDKLSSFSYEISTLREKLKSSTSNIDWNTEIILKN